MNHFSTTGITAADSNIEIGRDDILHWIERKVEDPETLAKIDTAIRTNIEHRHEPIERITMQVRTFEVA